MAAPEPDFSRHLLIDGNNIGRAWTELGRLWRREPAAARGRLIACARTWHDVMAWRVTVVFDGRGSEVRIERPAEVATLVVAHAPSRVTADTVIEQWVGRSRDPGHCTVATGDTALAATVRALGAEAISPADLRSWLDRAEQRSARRTGRLTGRGAA